MEHILSVKAKIEKFISSMATTYYWYSHSINFNGGLILTGGAIASLLQGEKPKDWDFYFENMEDCRIFSKIVTQQYKNDIADVDDHYKEFLGKDGKMITANSITMNNGASFITMLVGKPNEIRAHFDYVHCLPYYDLKKRMLYISKQQYDACVNKTLILNNKKAYKGYRHDKFIKRGYTSLYNNILQPDENKGSIFTGINS